MQLRKSEEFGLPSHYFGENKAFCSQSEQRLCEANIGLALLGGGDLRGLGVGFADLLFGHAGEVLHQAFVAVEADHGFVQIDLLADRPPGVDIEFDGAMLHLLHQLRLNLGVVDRRENLGLHANHRDAQ